MVPAPSVKVPRVSTYSGSRLPASVFAYGAFTLSGWSSQGHSANLCSGFVRSEPHGARAMVWALPVSLAATPGITVVFSSSGYLDVSVRRVPFLNLWIGLRMTEGFSAGFPHSDISGSQDICSSPKLFAAYHVFHRLLVPRHPPYALSNMTIPPPDTARFPDTCLRELPRVIRHTCIALHALVSWVNFFRPFSSDFLCFCNHYLFITITSDVLIIFSDIFSFFLYAVFKVHARMPLPGIRMENTRFELVTSCLQGRRSPN